MMTAAALAARTIGLALSAYIAGKIGTVGMGLYGLIMSVYFLGITFASAGIRTAATRLVIYEQAKQSFHYKSVIKKCVFYALILGALISVLLMLLSQPIAAHLLQDSRAVLPLRILSLSLPFVAMTSALSGFFIAQGSSVKLSCIQISELLIRLGACAFGFYFFIEKGIEAACGAIAAATALSEATSFVFALTLCAIDNRKRNSSGKTRRIFFSFARIALPEGVGAWVRSGLLTAEHLLIPIGLKKSGSSAESALSSYGLVSQIAFPLLLYPSCLLSSLSMLLIPEISLSYSQGGVNRISYMASKSIRLALFFSIGTAGVFFFFAEPLTFAIYSSSASAVYIRTFAPLVPIMFLDMTIDGILKGLDQQVSVMKYNIIDSAISVALVWLLVPKLSLDGYLITVYIAETVNFFLSLSRLNKLTYLKLTPYKDIVFPFICIIIAASIVSYFLKSAANQIFTAAAGTITCALLYFILLYLFGCITDNDTGWLKNIFKKQESPTKLK